MSRVKSLIDSYLSDRPTPLPVWKPDPSLVRPRRELPSDLFLTMGQTSVRLFARGPIDEFRFFQRRDVPAFHELEFLTRLDPADSGTENYKAFAIFDLRGEALALPDVSRLDKIRKTLAQTYGLEHMPAAKKLVQTGFSAWDYRDDAKGPNQLLPPSSKKSFKKVGGKTFSYGDVLDILVRELSGPELIAWIEDALPPPPIESPVAHRYYLDARRQAYLVRERRGDRKRLYLAQTSEDAIRACITSAHVKRFEAGAA